jgi:hypothetical protein
MAPPMFEGWSEYFFMIGSSAAALIGLMFIVITLTAGRDRRELERGKKLYTSPIVWHLSVILVLSGAAIAPAVPAKLFAVASGGLGILGFAMSVRVAVGIIRIPFASDPRFDAFWYGIAPTIAYVGLTAAAIGILNGYGCAPAAVAIDLMALLLLSIHAEWDLVTFLAPIAGQSGENKEP